MPAPRIPRNLLGRPFTVEQARQAGLTHAALQSRPWRQVFRTVWVHESVQDGRQLRVAAAALILPQGAVFGRTTAAWILGADVIWQQHRDVYVWCAPAARVRARPGLVVAQQRLAPADVMSVAGLPVTTPLRTAFDCLRLSPTVEAIAVADALGSLGHYRLEALREYVDGQAASRGIRSARARLELVDVGAESVMETRLRLILVHGGLPRPVTQLTVVDGRGRFVGRLDLAYPQWKIAVEYDGAWHWSRRRADDRRRDRLRALGWLVLVFSAEDVLRSSDEVVHAVAAAIESRSAECDAACL